MSQFVIQYQNSIWFSQTNRYWWYESKLIQESLLKASFFPNLFLIYQINFWLLVLFLIHITCSPLIPKAMYSSSSMWPASLMVNWGGRLSQDTIMFLCNIIQLSSPVSCSITFTQSWQQGSFHKIKVCTVKVYLCSILFYKGA